MSLSTVEASQPERLVSAAAAIGGKIAQLDGAMAEQRQALAQLRGSWEGQAANAAIAKAEQNLNKQEELRARLSALQSALQSGGSQLSSTKRAVLSLVNTLRATGWQVADDGTATAPPFPPLLKLFEPAWTAIIQKLLAVFDQIDAQTAAAITAALGGPVPETPAGTLGDPRKLPPPGTSAEDVKQWWDSLSADEQRQLIAEHPPELGNLNGIPAEVRDDVNQAVLQDDLDVVRDAAEQHGVSVDQVLDDPGQYGLTSADATRYTNAEKTQQGLADTAGKVLPDG
ncbi:hypothetical protein, partial [Micromonospora sp. WMMD736]|uniref:hypothetical protein n=1 Tax=Micromonospora sp. WMMD736 TaxID=3404112 RepID=UPI003B9344F3